MQNLMQKFRQGSFAFEKPETTYAHFLLSNIYKRVFEISFILLR